MLKTVITLLRGSAGAAAEDLADRNALPILDQQLRDAQAGVAAAQRALAVATAQDGAEERRCAALAERIAGLEARARAALAANRADMVLEAAEAIAGLEEELAAGRSARTLFAAEIGRLRRTVDGSSRRLAALDRGRRVARVAEAVRVARRGPIEPAGPARCTLSEAEATLSRLQAQQREAADALAALDGLEAEAASATVEDRLAKAGFGPANRPTAASVLARLNQGPTGASSS